MNIKSQKSGKSAILYLKRITLNVMGLLVLITTLASLPALGAEQGKQNFTLVIDAGHGGHDHGAIDNGAREKDINLGVATKLAALIKRKLKNVNVVMTRDKDNFVSLQERANIANRNKGDLFLSIHTNSVDKSNPNRTKISGASVYALGSNKSNDNLRVAQRENSVIELERDYHQKYSGFDPSKDESCIIFEMAQKKTIGQSLRFAEKAQRALVGAGRNDRGVRQAGFWVLWSTSMPAVLVELDFICNPQAASYLNSPGGQEVLAEALFSAVKQYVDAQTKYTADTFANYGSVSDSNGVEPRLSKKHTEGYEDGENMTFASEGEDNIGSLVTNSTERKTRAHNSATPTRRNTAGPRRRRSQAAREVSDSRNLETQIINQKSETAYLLKDEKPSEEVKEQIVVADDTKGKKGKKKKEKKKKEPKKKVDDNKSQKENKSNRGNQKTFVVKGSQSAAAGVTTSNGATSATKRVYKILLASSDREISKSDNRFQGLEPTGMFVENGMYKYTIGQSESRQEIERQLLDIRSSIPEATIIVRME